MEKRRLGSVSPAREHQRRPQLSKSAKAAPTMIVPALPRLPASGGHQPSCAAPAAACHRHCQGPARRRWPPAGPVAWRREHRPARWSGSKVAVCRSSPAAGEPAHRGPHVGQPLFCCALAMEVRHCPGLLQVPRGQLLGAGEHAGLRARARNISTAHLGRACVWPLMATQAGGGPRPGPGISSLVRAVRAPSKAGHPHDMAPSRHGTLTTWHPSKTWAAAGVRRPRWPSQARGGVLGCPLCGEPGGRHLFLDLPQNDTLVLLAGVEPRAQIDVVTVQATQLGDDLVQELVNLTFVVAATKLSRSEVFAEDILGHERHVVTSVESVRGRNAGWEPNGSHHGWYGSAVSYGSDCRRRSAKETIRIRTRNARSRRTPPKDSGGIMRRKNFSGGSVTV